MKRCSPSAVPRDTFIVDIMSKISLLGRALMGCGGLFVFKFDTLQN